MMRVFYHFLGALAKADSFLSRIRVNFVPANWIVLGVLVFDLYSFGSSAVDAVTNSLKPMEITVAQVNVTGAGAQHYVRLAGELQPRVIYRRENGTATEWWSPLVDRGSMRVILVKRSGNIDVEAPRTVQMEGMLRTLDGSARQRLEENGGRIDGLPVNIGYELAAGERPGDPPLAVGLAALNAILLAAWVAAMLRRYEVFQPDASFAAPLSVMVRQPVLVRVTGRLCVDAKTSRRFADMPAVLTTESGHVLIESTIDTTPRLRSMSTEKRIHIWWIAAAPGSIKGQIGFAYFGWARRHAYRFSYVDASDGKQRRATIAAEDPQTLMMAVMLATSGAYTTTNA